MREAVPVKLTVGGTLTLDGVIRANGTHGSGGGYLGGTGGGSGGSVYLTASTLAGTGTISANGGNGAGSTYAGGGGAGGRIAIYTCSMLFPIDNVTVNGGTGYRSGQPGTIYQQCVCEPPTNATATPAVLCSPGASSQLSATPGLGGEVEWFTDICGGTPVPGGASPIVAPETTTTYYARTKNGSGGGSGTCAAVTVTVVPHVAADFNGDCSVDGSDLAVFSACLSGPAIPRGDTPDCRIADFDQDEDVDQADYGVFQRCWSGTGRPADPNCTS